MCRDVENQAGAVKWHRFVAAGGWQNEIKEIAEVLQDPAALAHMGFISVLGRSPPDRLIAQEEEQFARFLFDFVVERLDSTILFGQYYSFGLLGCFGALNSEGPIETGKCFDYLSKAWAVLIELESLAMADGFYQDMMMQMLWPYNSWCRDVLLSAAENEFTSLNTIVAGEVLAMYRCMKSTKLFEDLGNLLRSSERQHGASKSGRVTCWHHTAHCDNLAGSDLRQPIGTASDAAQAKALLPKNIFLPDKTGFSLGSEVYDQFVNRTTKWHSPAAEHLCDTVF